MPKHARMLDEPAGSSASHSQSPPRGKVKPPKVSPSRSSHNAAFEGSVTEMQEQLSARSRGSRKSALRRTHSSPDARSCEGSELVVLANRNGKRKLDRGHSHKSMSAAPVETIAMRQQRESDTNLSKTAQRLQCLCGFLFPQSSFRGNGKLPFDYIFFMAILGCLSAVLGFAMDLGIERLTKMRHFVMELLHDFELVYADAGPSKAGWELLRGLYWVAHTLALCQCTERGER